MTHPPAAPLGDLPRIAFERSEIVRSVTLPSGDRVIVLGYLVDPAGRRISAVCATAIEYLDPAAVAYPAPATRLPR